MRKRSLRITTFGVIFTIFVLVWIFVVGISAGQKGSFYNKGHNATWLTQSFIGEHKNETDIQNLINNLKKHQIDTVFVNAGNLSKDGTIDPNLYSYAVDFLEKAKRYDANIKFQAWIGESRSKIDLKEDAVRRNLVKQTMIFGQLLGFDGVHLRFSWDFDNDDFFKLLKESKEILPEEKNLSIFADHFASMSFYRQAMKYADQIVVASYNSNIDSPWWYKWRVREQLTRLTRILKNKEVFIAVSAAKSMTETENIENALTGAINGLNNFRSKQENFTGVAIDPYFEMDENKWRIYEKLWQ